MSFAQFCEAFHLKLSKPASDELLTRAVEKLGAPLPPSVRKIYAVADGGKAKHDLSALEFLSLRKALQYARVPHFFDAPWALWPLFENNDSNPLCVCCKAPLKGYVVLKNHDDAPRLLFRSLESFFTAATALVAAGEDFESHDLPSDFDGPSRTTSDQAAAKRLLALLNKPAALEADDRTDAICFAADLLGDDDVDTIQALLDFDDPAAEEHITARLARLKPSKRGKAAKATKAKAETFADFVQRCGQLLSTSGVRANVVEMYGKPTIRLDPGPIWLNMPFLFEQRRRADFDAFFLESVRKVKKK